MYLVKKMGILLKKKVMILSDCIADPVLLQHC